MSCSIFGNFLSEQTNKKVLIFTDLYKIGIVLLICGYALLCHDKKKRALKIMTVARRHMQIFNNGAI